MKNIIFILLITHCSLLTAEAQWISQNSGTNQNLYDVEFINARTGWALGDGGVVLKTTNSGTNWISIPNPAVGKPLSSIHLVDSNNIYYVGWFETIIKSTNGGNSWIVIRNGPFGGGNSYDGLFFINKDTGWICGRGLYVLRTTDGGMTFDSSYLFWGQLSDMYFKDSNTGILSADGAVFKTTNSGVDWFSTNVPTNGVFYMFKKIAVVNDIIWIAGSSSPPVYKSTDFGNTWVIVDTLTGVGIRGITFIDDLTGFAGGGLNKLFKTTNGGYDWLQENTESSVLAFISTIEFINELTGWYVGGAGKIYHTTTGGQILVNINQNLSLSNIEKFELFPNYPNPFNPVTKLTFRIPLSAFVSLNIFNANGKLMESIISNRLLNKGLHSYRFDGEKLLSGVYYYVIEYGKAVLSKKMILIK